MKTIKLFTIILFISIAFQNSVVQAAQSGSSRQTRNVSEFHGISVSSGIDLYLTQKDVEEVVVEADADELDKIITKVEGGILKIYIKEKSWFNLNWTKESRKVYVSFKTIDKLEASAGSDVVSHSILNLEKLDLDASSGSDIKLELNASEVSAESSSGSDITLKGKANSIEVNSSSGSDIDAAEFQTKKCIASVSSGADIRVNVTEQLDASASSGGDISYSGNPEKKDINESSGGDVHGKR
jgi:hypothetical protein